MLPIKQLNQHPGKAGWRVAEWSTATGVGKTTTHALIKAKIVDSVKIAPRLRIILTPPGEYLARFKSDEDAQ